jgi:hypothetical protein
VRPPQLTAPAAGACSRCLGDRAVGGVALGGGEVGRRVGAGAAAEAVGARPAGEPVAAAAAAQAVVAPTAGAGLDDATLSISTPARLSTSATTRLTVPEWSLVPQVPPAATVTAGASLTALTVSVTVARPEVAVPSLAR